MADDTERITLLLQARDKDLQRALDRSNKLVQKYERDQGRAMTRSAQTVERNMARMGTAISAFAGGILGGVLAQGIASVTTNLGPMIRGIAQIGDEARRSGLGVTAFQELSFVATQSRIPVDSLIDGMKELNLRADEFVTTGKGPAADAFERLGYGAEELARGLERPEELLLDIVDRMENLDRAAQIRVADEVFGGTGGERFVELLRQGDEGIRELMNRAHEVGAVIDEDMIDKAAELDRRFQEVVTSIGTHLKSEIVNVAALVGGLNDDVAKLSDYFDNAARAAAVLGQDTADALEDAGEVTADQASAIEDIIAAYEELASYWRNNTQKGMSLDLSMLENVDAARELGSILDEIDRSMRAFNNGSRSAAEFEADVGEAVDRATDLISELNAVDAAKFGGAISGINSLADALANARDRGLEARAALPFGASSFGGRGGDPRGSGGSAADWQAEIQRRRTEGASSLAPTSSPRPRVAPNDIDFGMPTISPGTGGGGGGGGGRSRPSDWAREVESLREEITELETEAASFLVAAEMGREFGDAAEYARKRAELLFAAQQSNREITPELVDEVDGLARAYLEAAAGAEAAERALERMEEDADRGADALGDMFTSILDGSKSAREALSDLLLDIARVQLRQGVARLVSGVGGTTLLGNLLGGARAYGGSAQAGTPYLVNEGTSRSEVFVPSRSGAVLSVPQAQSALRSSVEPAAGVVDVRLHVSEGVTVEDIDSRATRVAVEVVQDHARRATEARRRG